MKISIADIHTCQLNCKNCFKHEISDSLYNYTDLETFKHYIDKVVELGYTGVDITPLYGDPALIPNTYKKMEYLENHPNILEFTTATNLLGYNNIIKLLKFKKLILTVSVYGYDKDSYKQRTGLDNWDIFKTYLIMLNSIIDINCKIVLQNRLLFNHDKFLTGINTKFQVDNEQLVDYNYTNTNTIKKHGVCEKLFKDRILTANGDLYCCCWCTLKEEFKCGTIDNPNYENLNTIIKDQILGKYNDVCKCCTDFKKVHKQDVYELGIGELLCKLI